MGKFTTYSLKIAKTGEGPGWLNELGMCIT